MDWQTCSSSISSEGNGDGAPDGVAPRHPTDRAQHVIRAVPPWLHPGEGRGPRPGLRHRPRRLWRSAEQYRSRAASALDHGPRDVPPRPCALPLWLHTTIRPMTSNVCCSMDDDALPGVSGVRGETI
jgi:hypothetical protein